MDPFNLDIHDLVSTMATDEMAAQGARPSGAKVLTQLSRIPRTRHQDG